MMSGIMLSGTILNGIILSIIMLSGIMLGCEMLSAVATPRTEGKRAGLGKKLACIAPYKKTTIAVERSNF